MIELPKEFSSIQPIVPVISSLVAVTTSVCISILRDYLSRRKKNKAFRVMLAYEVKNNLDLIQHFRDEICDFNNEFINSIKDNNDDILLTLSSLFMFRASRINIPELPDRIWKSDITLVVDALSKHEISEMIDFYSNLMKLISIHKQIIKVVDSSQEIGVISKKYGYIGFMLGDTKLWDNFNNIICMTLGKGNPVQGKSIFSKILRYHHNFLSKNLKI